eukprot:scaffold31385_cov62-Phaeocystis_antarctica.AAC.8
MRSHKSKASGRALATGSMKPLRGSRQYFAQRDKRCLRRLSSSHAQPQAQAAAPSSDRLRNDGGTRRSAKGGWVVSDRLRNDGGIRRSASGGSWIARCQWSAPSFGVGGEPSGQVGP